MQNCEYDDKYAKVLQDQGLFSWNMQALESMLHKYRKYCGFNESNGCEITNFIQMQ